MSSVVIFGEGMLADMVCRRLSGFSVVCRSDLSEGIPDDAELVLVLQEQDSSDLHLEADAALRPFGIPWLSAYVFLGEGVVGPLMRPGTTGCFQCAEMRLSVAGSNRKEAKEMLMRLVMPDDVPPCAAEISPAGFHYMAHIIAEETGKVLQGGRANSEGHIYVINFRNLNSTLHYVLPNGTCPVCGRLPDDSPEAAEITLRPSLTLHNSYRCRSMNDLREFLFQDYWDNRTGILNDKKLDLVSAFAGAVVNLPLGYYNEVTGGRSHSYADSQLAAILEGLERFCGTTPRGKRTVVFDSYSRLTDAAMDPSTAGFHAKEQFELPDFSFTPFDPESLMEWVWGYSFLQERPILVPQLLAYYSLGYREGFVYETSNGCAVGGSLEEAILYGIFEVVERDSFLMTWYARLPVPQLDPDSPGDGELSLMIHHLRAVTGYEVLLYNTTMENGIPSIWAIAKGGAAHQVNLVCAAGAHLDPIRAAKGAIHELSGMISMTEERWRKRKPEAESMFEDSFQVQQMEDHALLYSLPQAEERLQFLLDERVPIRTFAEEFPSVPVHKDLTDDLQRVLQVFRSLQMDVIVVDQSSSETLRNGLHCVKVLIPGMLPMTFGHHLRRLEGLDRVLEVPMKLGYVRRRLTPEELNPYPHPFP